MGQINYTSNQLEEILDDVTLAKGGSNSLTEKINQTDILVENISASMADIANVIVASGTGTAITLNMPSVTAYTTNMKLTFIATIDNSGGATTIDINSLGAKNLYKSNTTTAPNLKSGKPYTVWYNGTHFFLQASAEGNALAEHVLAGKTFSNDDDTGIVGIIDLSNLNANNVKEGVNINGVIGNVKPSYFATGTRFVNYQAYTGKSYIITGLKFRPKIVFVYDTNMYCKASVMDALKENYDVDLNYDKIDTFYKQSECSVFISEINDDGFQLDTSRSSDMSMSGNVRWIAIG